MLVTNAIIAAGARLLELLVISTCSEIHVLWMGMVIYRLPRVCCRFAVAHVVLWSMFAVRTQPLPPRRMGSAYGKTWAAAMTAHGRGCRGCMDF